MVEASLMVGSTWRAWPISKQKVAFGKPLKILYSVARNRARKIRSCCGTHAGRGSHCQSFTARVELAPSPRSFARPFVTRESDCCPCLVSPPRQEQIARLRAILSAKFRSSGRMDDPKTCAFGNWVCCSGWLVPGLCAGKPQRRRGLHYRERAAVGGVGG